MSIANDIRTYADNAVNQGKHVFDQAQAQLNDVTGQANEFYGKTRENVTEIANKATTAVHDLRVSAEKAINIEAIKTAVEPYIVQAKEYRSTVADRAETLFETVKHDKRVVKLVDAAEQVVETVQERVVKPVRALTVRGAKPVTKPAAKATPTVAAAKPVTKPAATKPAAKPVSKPVARKAPARRTTKS
jgi:ABC-type transporter Mla subunit MlaD